MAPKIVSAHTLVAFGGKLGTGSSVDGWQCGIRIMQGRLGVDYGPEGTNAALTNPALYLSRIFAGLASWFATPLSTTVGSEFMALRSDATLEWVKVNNITAGEVGKGNPGGKYADKSTTNVHTYTPVTGASAATVPGFVTAAVSLTTDKQRGPGHRGRIYLPLAIVSVGTGRLTTQNQTQCIKTVKALLDVLNNAQDQASNGTDLPVDPVIASRVNGTLNPIRGIACGDVYDVQRRRKEQLVENYTSITYTP